MLCISSVPASAFPVVAPGQSPIPDSTTVRWLHRDLVVRFVWARQAHSTRYGWQVLRMGRSLADIDAQDQAIRQAEIERERVAYAARQAARAAA